MGVALAVWAVAFSILAVVAAIPEGPTAALSVDDAYPSVGIAVHFNASASTGHDQGNGRIVAYRFAFGDGGGTVWQTSALVAHAYAAAGTFTATVAVIDLRNQTGTASAVIHVGGSPPPPPDLPDVVPVSLQASPPQPHVNDTVNVTVVVLNRGRANATSATVDGYEVGPDGTVGFLGSVPMPEALAPAGTETLRFPSFVPTQPGNYTIRAVVNNVSPATPGAPVHSLDLVVEVLPRGMPPTPGPQGAPAFDMGPIAIGLSAAAVASMAAAGYFLLRRPPKGPLEPPPHQPPDRSPPPIWPP